MTALATMLFAALLTALLAAPAVAVEPASSFYRGKTVTLYVGYSPGGAYDIYARMLARHLAAHIDGSPRLIVSNMEGAGSLRLANYLYNAAPKDGTALGIVNRGAPFEPLIGETALARFDAARFTWIGNVGEDVSTCVVSNRTTIRTFADLLAVPVTMGGTGAGADTNLFPKLLNGVFGTRIRLVSGYPGGNDIDFAMERGEVDGRCGWSWSSLSATRKEWIDGGFVRIVLQLSLRSHPDLAGVPLAMDYAVTEEQREILRLVLARSALGYPLLAPPGVPGERTAVLRAAFEATMKDPAFLAEAARANLEVVPVSGASLQALVAEIYRTPPAIVEMTRAMLR